MAQYKSGSRTPKADLTNKLAEVFGVSASALTIPGIDSYNGFPHTGPKNSPHFEGNFGRNQSQIETDFDHRLGASTLPGNRGLISAGGGNQSHHGTQFDHRSMPKIKGGGQASGVLARLDDSRAKPGGVVNGGAQSAPFVSTIDGPDWACYLTDKPEVIFVYRLNLSCHYMTVF